MSGIIGLALSVSTYALAQDAEPLAPKVTPGGVVAAHYGYILTDGEEGYNEFALDRAYLQLDGKVNDTFSARIIVDASRAADATHRVFVKNAYIEAKEALGPVTVQAGVIGTPYLGQYDDFWGNRYIAGGLAEEVGVLAGADLGASLSAKHAEGKLDWNVAVLNGEGFNNLEIDAGKTAQGRVTFNPMAGNEGMTLPINGFVSYAGDATDDTPAITYAASVGFQIPVLRVWGEFLGRAEDGVSGMGYSATVVGRIPDVVDVILRYDHWDPTGDVEGDDVNKLIAGIDKDFNSHVGRALTYERGWSGGAPDAPTHGVFVHTALGF